MMLQSTWPFSLFFATNPGVPAHNVELERVLPTTQAQAIRAQDAKDALLYANIEQHCDDLKTVRQGLKKRRQDRRSKNRE